jgi:hypothetical protein
MPATYSWVDLHNVNSSREDLLISESLNKYFDGLIYNLYNNTNWKQIASPDWVVR